MRKILLAVFGILALLLSACGASAESTPVKPVPTTEIFISPSESPLPASTDASIPAAETSAPTRLPTREVSFANDVMPILDNSCNKCHGIEQVKEGLDMTNYDSLMAGSFNGAVITPGRADDSFLAEQVVSGEMPKRGDKLTAGQIQTIIEWINAGALNN